MKSLQKFKADSLWVDAVALSDSLITNEELRSKDYTDQFWREIELRVQNGEHININFTGRVRTGKSVAASHICMAVKNLIYKYHKVKRPMGVKNIVRDQNEYSRLVRLRPEELVHECDVIDEWSTMELTGFNSTVESQFLQEFSDVQAKRKYHRISCSPRHSEDRNADILLQTVPGSREKGKTMCLLSYRLQNTMGSTDQLLGYVVFDVQNVLDAKWYDMYETRKSAKFAVLNKVGVKPRELLYSRIVNQAYHELKDAAKYTKFSTRTMNSTLKEYSRRTHTFLSILGSGDLTQDILGLLEFEHDTYKHIKKAEYYNSKNQQELARQELIAAKKKAELRDSIIERLERDEEIWEEYNSA